MEKEKMFLTETTEGTEMRDEKKEDNVGFVFFAKKKNQNQRLLSVNSVRSVRAFRGFTLVELMIVMLVIAIMVGITIPISQYVSHRAREANQKVYIEKIKSALEDYRAAYGEYPITPNVNTNTGAMDNDLSDVKRHYTDNLNAKTPTKTYIINLTTNTVDTMQYMRQSAGEEQDYANRIDYCLTWPLMLKQRAMGARPFMDFKEVTVGYIAVGSDSGSEVKRRKKSGGFATKTIFGLWSDPINRPKAIDPVSEHQWKYRSDNGLTYTLGTNSF